MSRASAASHEKHREERARKANKRRKTKAKLKEALEEFVEGFVDAVEDDLNPLIDLRFKMTDDGRFLAIIKREYEIHEQVIFNSGETFWEAFQGLGKKIMNDWWKISLPWSPPDAK